MSERVSASKFAQLAGCDEKQVRRALEKGLLVRGDDGLLDASLVDTAWRKPNARTIKKSSDKSKNVRSKVVRAAPSAHAAALEKKESYRALLTQLEYEKEIGSVVLLETARAVFFEAFREQRDAWLNWPMRVGARIAADLGQEADLVTEILTKHVHEHISHLAEPKADFRERQG